MNKKIFLFGIHIDKMDMNHALMTIESWINEKTGERCHYVVTPNVQHVVQLQRDKTFKEAYASASMVLADGKPVVMASRMTNMALPGTVPGSDLIPALFENYHLKNKQLRVFLLGAGPGVASIAAEVIEKTWSPVKVVGKYSPPFGFDRDDEECRSITTMINSANADVLIIGLGAPKQELWIFRHRNELKVKVAFCVGATIDFLAGEKPRAPTWMRNLGVEWIFRIISEPKRLARRYAYDAVFFVPLLLKELWRCRSNR